MTPIKGFRPTKVPFMLPDDAAFLPNEVKRKLTICNLFANHDLSAHQIMQLLDEKYGNVIDALIENNLVYDRRKNPHRLIENERRLSHFTK
jgi:hypothetical protein